MTEPRPSSPRVVSPPGSPGTGSSPGTGVGARERMLGRIRTAIGDDVADRQRRVDAEYAALPRDYLTAHHEPAAHDIVALFAERAADYRAVVERVPASALPDAIARVLAGRAAPSNPAAPSHPAAPSNPAAGLQFIVPQGLPAGWLDRCAEGCPQAALISDDPPLDTALLDAAAGVVTGCAVAIAETGTIVLDHGPGQGRRAVTLVPDFHLVVVRHDQVAADLPGAFARLDAARPHTLISGPSATSDIELVRVEGVHGPRTLHVLITDPA
jgi:L-lactate dehydrogenase complex protein LldG